MRTIYRLLIVDDDEILRQGLINNIDWKGHHIEVVGVARNGKEAIAKIEEGAPHVILSDIQMPLMNGIELAEFVYKVYPKIKIVLLTAYEEFEYAKKALQFKVHQYILKYETNEEIVQSVLNAASQYNEEIKREEMLKRNQSIVRKDFFRDIYFSNPDRERMEQKLKENELLFEEAYFCAAALTSEIPTGHNNIQGLIEQKKQYTEMECRLMDVFEKQGQSIWIFQDKDKLWSVIAAREEDQCCQSVELYIEQIQTIAQQQDIFAGIGKCQKGLESLHESFLQAQIVISLSNILREKNNTAFVYSGEIENQGTMMEAMEAIVQYINEMYADEGLCLNKLSHKVHLTPNYISTLFKKYMGITISDYMIQVRMEQAKKLLTSTNLKTYEIAEKIGYRNAQYFSVLFKKHVGFSPVEYRNKTGG